MALTRLARGAENAKPIPHTLTCRELCPVPGKTSTIIQTLIDIPHFTAPIVAQRGLHVSLLTHSPKSQMRVWMLYFARKIFGCTASPLPPLMRRLFFTAATLQIYIFICRPTPRTTASTWGNVALIKQPRACPACRPHCHPTTFAKNSRRFQHNRLAS